MAPNKEVQEKWIKELEHARVDIQEDVDSDEEDEEYEYGVNNVVVTS